MIDLFNGDCLEVMKNIADKSVDLIVTDPPYLIEVCGAGMYKQKDKQYVKQLNSMKDGFSEKILEEFCRVMKKINCYIFCSQKQILPLISFFVENKKCNYNLLCWHKTNPVPACGNKYLTDTEYCLFFRERGVKVFGTYGTKKTYYLSPLNQKDKKKYNHPTIKPLELVRDYILNSSKEESVVLDCFMGSGTTGVACKQLNRNFIGIELDKNYFEIAKKRIEES